MVGARRLTAPTRAGPDLTPWVDRLVALEHVEPAPVVACSGGADSVALLALVAATGRTPTAVHVDHGLRADGAAEAAFVARVAARLGAEARAVSIEVSAGPNLEARARDARYVALDAARRAVGASTVLVAHTADDQAETVLLNLMRGSAS
ncbi:MAG: tRNA lysidine(34) synthetase TilS, partial [Acidimicrobiia bacterium]